MSSIPSKALAFGATSMTGSPVAYGKSRVAGNQATFTTNASTSPGLAASVSNNQTIGAFRRQACATLCIPVGPRDAETCPHAFTFEEFHPHDDETLKEAIEAAYRQVYGNFHAMESERAPELEERLLNGDISMREFVRRLAKTPFYRSHYFDSVSQQRAIELNFKHILGRPPANQAEVVSQVELMNSAGFEAAIDNLIDSAEYQEVFGADIVPYLRCWNSPAGITTSSFGRTAALQKRFATSDNAIGNNSQLIRSLAEGSTPKMAERKAVGGGGKDLNLKRFTVSWVTRLQIGMARCAAQKSVVPYNSLPSTVRGIMSQGGKIVAVEEN